MKIKKMSLANIKRKLSRTEMKKIMAGSGSGSGACASTICGIAGLDCGSSCTCNSYPGGKHFCDSNWA